MQPDSNQLEIKQENDKLIILRSELEKLRSRIKTRKIYINRLINQGKHPYYSIVKNFIGKDCANICYDFLPWCNIHKVFISTRKCFKCLKDFGNRVVSCSTFYQTFGSIQFYCKLSRFNQGSRAYFLKAIHPNDIDMFRELNLENNFLTSESFEGDLVNWQPDFSTISIGDNLRYIPEIYFSGSILTIPSGLQIKIVKVDSKHVNFTIAPDQSSVIQSFLNRHMYGALNE